jgi:membrane-associated phospholipid phosphatase
LRLRYGIRVWPWLLTTALGTMMAIERMGSGDHFPTDVIVGAVAGLAIGITVPWLHERAPEAHVRLVPSQGGLGLAGEF